MKIPQSLRRIREDAICLLYSLGMSQVALGRLFFGRNDNSGVSKVLRRVGVHARPAKKQRRPPDRGGAFGCPFIQLTKGYVAIVDPEDYAYVAQFEWSASITRRSDGSPRIYAVRHLPKLPNQPRYSEKMHRVILGVTDPKILIDHKDRNGLNNTRANLRQANRSGNLGNQVRGVHSSKFKGVSLRRGRWVAAIGGGCAGKKNIIGYYKTETDAALAYNAAARHHFGDFALLNDIEGAN